MTAIKAKYVVLVMSTLAGLVPGVAFAQTASQPKQAATKPKSKPVEPPTESPEHKFAVERVAYLTPLCEKAEKEYNEVHQQVEDALSREYTPAVDFLLRSARSKLDIMNMSNDSLQEAKYRLEHVDDCLKVYRQTMTKKHLI